MKQFFSLICALMLLVTSVSGAFVAYAATAEETLLPQMRVAELAADGELLEPVDTIAVAGLGKEPEYYAATALLEEILGEEFGEYLQPYIAKCATEINISKFEIPTGDWMFLANLVFYEYPELFSPRVISAKGSSGYITTLVIEDYQDYADTPTEYAACLQGIREARDYLVRDVKNNTVLSQAEKALVLHDRLAVWTQYDLGIYLQSNYGETEIYSAVGPLMNQSGVCQGYALAYTYLLEEVDIESDLCLSDTLNHAWNIVVVDGFSYHVDVTWDDPVNMDSNNTLTNTYYDNYGRVLHENFLLSSEGIWNSGHKAEDYSMAPTNTRYDNAGWWRNSETAIQLIGDDQLYYLDSNNGWIYQHVDGQNREVLADPNGLILGSAGERLLYTSGSEVILLDPATGTTSNRWLFGGDIEGMKYEKGKIHVQVKGFDGHSQRESVSYVDPTMAVKIVTQPKSVYAGEGTTAKLTVGAKGDGLTYTWYHKSANAASYKVSSATGPTYAVKMSAAVHGRYVFCDISDMYGNTVRTNVVRLYMGKLAKIVTQPTNGVAPNGKTAKITVEATGDGLTYTWYHKSAHSAKYSKASVTGATYAVKVSSTVHGRYVYCVVTDKYGSTVKSNVVRVFMGTPVKITTQPKSKVVTVGVRVEFNVKAKGSGLKYQWYIKRKGETAFTKSSTTTSYYTIFDMSRQLDRMQLYCVVTDKYGAVAKSDTVTLYMGNETRIHRQPESVVVTNGKTAKVSVWASGDGLKYAWYYMRKGQSKYTKASSTKDVFSVKMASKWDGTKVYCEITDDYGISTKTQVVTLNKGNPIKIKTQPKDVAVPVGKTAKVSVKATGDGLKYQWYEATSAAKKLSGATKSTFSKKMTSSYMNYKMKVFCLITDKYGVSVRTKTVTITGAKKLKIYSQPVGTTVVKGQSAEVSVYAEGDGVKYQWYYADKGSSSFKKLSGQTKTTYSVKMTAKVNGRKVYCKITDKYGNSVKTKTVTLKMSSFEPIKGITGKWRSYSAYSFYTSYVDFKKATMTISSDKKVKIKVTKNDMFTTGSFTYNLKFETFSNNEATYYLYNSAGELAGTYDVKNKIFEIRLNDGSKILFKR